MVGPLGSIASVWREKARAIYWALVPLDTEAAKIASHLPPRALIGRWGSISEVEKYVFTGDEHSVRKALGQVASGGKVAGDKGKQRKRKQQGNDIDAAVAEFQEEYAVKMSIACQHVVSSTETDFMWILGRISRTSRAPLDHFYNWLKKKNGQFHESALGGIEAAMPQSEIAAVAELVCFKAEEIQGEFEKLLRPERWGDVLGRADSIERQRLYVMAIFTIVLRNACVFDFRVVKPGQTYPRRIFLLLKDHPDTATEFRKNEAQHLLDCRNLDSNTRKLRNVLHKSICVAAAEGILQPEAYNYLRLLATTITGDTQEIEGMNNVAKSIVRLAPKVALSLVSCRLTFKKLLGLGKARAKRQWKPIANRFNKLCELAEESWTERNTILAKPNRFAASPAVPFKTEEVKPPPVNSPAKTLSLKWYWLEGSKAAVNQCLAFDLGAEETFECAWLHVWSYNLEGYMIRVKLINRSAVDELPMVILSTPLVRTQQSERRGM